MKAESDDNYAKLLEITVLFSSKNNANMLKGKKRVNMSAQCRRDVRPSIRQSHPLHCITLLTGV